MAKEVFVEGYNEFVKAAEKNKDKLVIALFCGSKDANGESWCPDCVAAEPVIQRNLALVPAEAVFIHCGIGQKTYWKDMENDFRKDPKLRLKYVPTLIKLGTPQRLEDVQCVDESLVQMFFEEEASG